MRTREKDQPHAHELYDLLADIHIRVSVFFCFFSHGCLLC